VSKESNNAVLTLLSVSNEVRQMQKRQPRDFETFQLRKRMIGNQAKST